MKRNSKSNVCNRWKFYGRVIYLLKIIMGSYIEINDTLQITNEQGFPKELVYKKHLEKNFTPEDFKEKIFEFKDKPNIRIYHMPPVRNFLVQNIDGKWLYW